MRRVYCDRCKKEIPVTPYPEKPSDQTAPRISNSYPGVNGDVLMSTVGLNVPDQKYDYANNKYINADLCSDCGNTLHALLKSYLNPSTNAE